MSESTAFEGQDDRLLACIHCGFCLPACPTYQLLGDEADSPRGRLHLMRAVAEGRMSGSDPAFITHIDRCLGCRACEPVCPAGVEYGILLEHARETAAASRPQGFLGRALLAVFGNRVFSRFAGVGGRLLRWGGFAGLLARSLPELPALHSARAGLSMVAATRPRNGRWRRRSGPSLGAGAGPDGHTSPVSGGEGQSSTAVAPSPRGRVGLLSGCVQAGLFGRVAAAATRTLEANGYTSVAVAEGGCCGALHAHSGELSAAREAARRQIQAFEAASVDWVGVDAAGCGAAMKGYGTLLEGDPEWADRARAFAARVRDVSELLAAAGPRPGGCLEVSVAYDPPCHLLHGQGVDTAVRALFDAVPGLELKPVRNAEGCCGGAGIYGITHRELGGAIGGDKVTALAESGAGIVASGNPGCMMQIGGGLLLRGISMEVVHPLELLDASYRTGGFYGTG